MPEKFETLNEYLAEQFQDPEFCEEWIAQQPAYQLARLRIMRGLTQAELAERVGTQQPSIARLEGGKVEPTLPFLRRVAEALDAEVTIQILPKEQVRESVGKPC
jgi:transcriptional regulator with XRE-family HTH domain